ncbi:MAG: hypothetical protein J7L20_01390 [Thermoplasmata archaeon]|nr:hypothetical protein [Thermoplasmata archaeon]
MKRTIPFTIIVCSLLISVGQVTAVEEKIIQDQVGDVKSSMTNQTVDIPCIDIEKVTYYRDGKNVTVTLQVAGKLGRAGIEEKYYMYSVVIGLITKLGDEERKYDIMYVDMDFGEMMGEKMKYKKGVVLFEGKNISNDVGPAPGTDDKLRAFFQLKDENEISFSINATTILMATNEISLVNGNFSKEGMDTLYYEFPKPTAPVNQTNQTGQDGGHDKKTPDIGITGIIIAVIAVTAILIALRKRR